MAEPDIENVPINLTPPSKSRKKASKFKSKKVKIAGIVLLVILLMAGAAYAAYYSQHKKVTAANAKITVLNKSRKNLNKQIATLQTENKKLSSQSKSQSTSSTKAVDQSDLKITVDSSLRYNYQCVNTPDNGIAINITITNPTASSISLIPGNILLQDNALNTYKIASYPGGSCKPPDYVKLNDQSIAPGGKVKGALFYLVDDTSLKNFKLLNGSNKYDVTLP